jgi:hypothetical protein
MAATIHSLVALATSKHPSVMTCLNRIVFCCQHGGRAGGGEAAPRGCAGQHPGGALRAQAGAVLRRLWRGRSRRHVLLPGHLPTFHRLPGALLTFQ